jgi:ketosteroid isomerase-like protein
MKIPVMNARSGSAITAAEVEDAVRRYWSVAASKQTTELQSFYLDTASIFATTSKRLEPARLVTARRNREYMNSASRMSYELGAISVEMLTRDSAIAIYNARWRADQIAKPSARGGKTSDENITNLRVTHVFQRQENGRLKIIHEHLSVCSG